MKFNIEGNEPKKIPLSQATGKKKIAVTVPFIFIGCILLAKNIPGGLALIMIPGAYALVGLIEILGGKSLSNASQNWDALPKWKKIVYPFIFILVFFIAVGFLLSAMFD